MVARGATPYASDGHERETRRHVDDGSLRTRAQEGREQLRQVDRRLEVDGELALRLGPRLVGQQVDAALDAGIVDDDVEVRVRGGRPLEQRHTLLGARHVGDVRVDRRQALLDAREQLATAAEDDHLVALSQETLSERQTDARRGAGDEDRTASEEAHDDDG